MGSDSPESKAYVTLPPEILDKILGYVPTDTEGQQTLIVCALVATWWTGPSQRRLFSSVSICDQNYQRWMDGVVLPRPKIHLLQYVRSLLHSRTPDTGTRRTPDTKYSMLNFSSDAGQYLFALRNIHSLTLSNIKIEHIRRGRFYTFLAFRETLTDLSLDLFVTSFSMFVTLVDYFPNITALQLGSFGPKPDEGPVPPLTRPLRGNITVRNTNPDCLEFFNRLSKLDLEYEGLAIESYVSMEIKLLESILQSSASTVKYLRLTCAFQRGAPTIHHFRQLRELELKGNWSSSAHQSLLSSITSTKLRKIIFPVSRMDDWNISSPAAVMGAPMDGRLCDLVARVGTRHNHALEVEMRLVGIGDDLRKHDFTKFLPRFREKGVFTVIDTAHDDLVLHSSAHSY